MKRLQIAVVRRIRTSTSIHIHKCICLPESHEYFSAYYEHWDHHDDLSTPLSLFPPALSGQQFQADINVIPDKPKRQA
jgi:hypothetical protein